MNRLKSQNFDISYIRYNFQVLSEYIKHLKVIID